MKVIMDEIDELNDGKNSNEGSQSPIPCSRNNDSKQI
jgi:hypothetical protein